MADRKKLYRLAALLLVFSVVAVSAVGGTSWGDYIESQVGRSVLFYTRSLMGQTPELDSRLKIYAYDDQTAAEAESHDFTLRTWHSFFEKISQQQPKAIIVDKVFGFPMGKTYASSLVDQRKNLTPIYGGAFVLGNEIATRKNIADQFDPPRSASPIFTTPDDYEQYFRDTPIFHNVYGPAGEILPFFSGIGHLGMAGYATTQPLVRIRQQGWLPHISLLAAETVRYQDGFLNINGKPTPIQTAAPVLANLSSHKTYAEKTQSIAFLRLQEGIDQLTRDVGPDDIVLVLPLMYSGNVDWKETPIGKIQGGYIIAAMVNSVLTGNWLATYNNIFLFALLASLLGTGLGLSIRLTHFWLAYSLAIIGGFAAAMMLFAYGNAVVPWIHTLSAFSIPAILIFERRSALKKGQARVLKDALEGVIPTTKVNELLNNPAPFLTDASEQVLTVMFIDIVGFSRASEQLTPKDAFESLRSYFDSLIEIIHKHDGAVDKLLGDGILCYFGYRFKDMPPVQNHPDKALQCAIEIQKNAVAKCIAAKSNNEPVFPVRIGINTATVYFGDLGGSRRVEFTCIGSGVNLAHRLESSCDPFRIVIGISTMDLMRAVHHDSINVTKKIVQIKHQFEPIEAFEYDIFPDVDQEFSEAFNAYRSYSNLQRLENRWPIPQEGAVAARTNYGTGQIVDFSRSGFGLVLESYLGKGVTLTLDLFSEYPALEDHLQKLGQIPIVAEVRWSRKQGVGFLHGVLIKNLHDDQRQELIEILREALIHKSRLNVG